MTPLVGFHFLLSVLLALLMRGNAAAAMIGTVVGNPWTFPFIWLGTYELGSWILDIDPGIEGLPAFTDMFGDLVSAGIKLDGAMFLNHVWPLWWPMMLGSIPIAVLVWLITFKLLLRSIAGLILKKSRLT